MPDGDRGGFFGEIDPAGLPVPGAGKSTVLSCRLLWYFSAMATWLDSPEALILAHRAADYVHAHVLSPSGDHVCWMVDHDGAISDGRRITLAQAHAVLAFCEYYRASQDPRALAVARTLQTTIERTAWDPVLGGYGESAACQSGTMADDSKTLGAHLHVMEAYTCLHACHPDPGSRAALYRVLDTCLTYFARPDGRVAIAYERDWTATPALVSFGHDAEISWLVTAAAEACGDRDLRVQAHRAALGLADGLMKAGVNDDFSLRRGRDSHGRLDPDGEWWAQAEGLVAFANAWELTGDTGYLHALARLWQVIKEQFGGAGAEPWSWYAAASGRTGDYQAGLWKCPYHTGRALMELDRRLGGIDMNNLPAMTPAWRNARPSVAVEGQTTCN